VAPVSCCCQRSCRLGDIPVKSASDYFERIVLPADAEGSVSDAESDDNFSLAFLMPMIVACVDYCPLFLPSLTEPSHQ